MSNLSASTFGLIKSDFAASLNVSVLVAFFKSVFVAKLDKSTLTLIYPPNGSYGLGSIDSFVYKKISCN